MKKTQVKTLALLMVGIIMIGMSGCGGNEDCCTIIDVDVRIHYQTQAGDNLINSVDDFKESNIKVYYMKGEEFEYVNSGNLDFPNMHRIDEDGNGNLILTVFPSNYYEDNQSTTLIELNPNVVDTLVGEFELGSNKEILKRAWLNGVEMTNRFIEVMK